MNRDDLVSKVSKSLHLERELVERVVKSTLSTIKRTNRKNNIVDLKNFGRFTPVLHNNTGDNDDKMWCELHDIDRSPLTVGYAPDEWFHVEFQPSADWRTFGERSVGLVDDALKLTVKELVFHWMVLELQYHIDTLETTEDEPGFNKIAQIESLNEQLARLNEYGLHVKHADLPEWNMIPMNLSIKNIMYKRHINTRYVIGEHWDAGYMLQFKMENGHQLTYFSCIRDAVTDKDKSSVRYEADNPFGYVPMELNPKTWKFAKILSQTQISYLY